MAIDFPTSPTVGQQVTSGSRTWSWSGSHWQNNTITGVQGLQGIQGVQGTQGTQGTQGAQGLQGISGASILGLNNTFTGVNSININGTVGATTPSSIAATTGTFSSTLGVSGDTTLGQGGTAAVNMKAFFNGSSGTGRGPELFFQRNSVSVGEIGTESAFTGNTSDNLIIQSVAGSIKFYNSTTNIGTFTSTGLNSTAIGATTPSTGAFTTGIINLSSGSDQQETLSVRGNSGVGMLLRPSFSAGTQTNWRVAASIVASATLEITPSTAVGGTTFTTPVATFTSTGAAITGTLSATTGANFATSSGNVGIGTTGPGNKFHVLGTSNDTINSSNTNVRFEGSGGNGLAVGVIASSPYTSYIQSGYVPNFATAVYPLSLNPNGGNVGIGTTSPAQLLDILGTGAPSANINALALELQRTGASSGGDEKVGILFRQNNNSGASTMFDATRVYSQVEDASSNGSFKLVFATKTNGGSLTDRAVISSTGLAVTGGITATANVIIGGGAGNALILNASGSGYGLITNFAANEFALATVASGTTNSTGTPILSWAHGNGVKIGSPTDYRGVGTLNLSADVYKNGTAYTNPDYVIEKWATGSIVKYADKVGAKEYNGLEPLSAVEAYAKEKLHLPRFGQNAEHGIFSGSDALLASVEEAYLYLFQQDAELQSLRKRLAALEAK